MGVIDDSFPSAYNSNDGSEHPGAAENFVEHAGYGRGASTSDAAQRGSKRSPLTEGMPVSPEGNLPYGAYDK